MSNITIINGNIFNTKAQTIVNTVNCVGVMGKGIALVFKLRYPAMFDIYQDFCKQGLIGIGKLWIYKGDARDPWVLNFPTKTHWKLPSEYEYIEKGLQKFVETYKEKGITSIAFPLLGANNGGLDGKKVEELMISYLSQCDIPIEIYRIETIDLAVNSESVRSMISLIEFPGIGIKTMESCFKIVMRSQSTVLPFNNDNV